jgi:hypothetical protein
MVTESKGCHGLRPRIIMNLNVMTNKRCGPVPESKLFFRINRERTMDRQ